MRDRLAKSLGMGGAATIALALLTLGCVFAATAGPREALAARTQALRQTLASTQSVDKTITATTTWGGIRTALAPAGDSSGGPPADLTGSQFGEITRQLHDGYSRGMIRLAPLAQDWAGMTTTTLHQVVSDVRASGGYSVRLEVGYRQPFTQFMRLVAGRYPAPATVSPLPKPTQPTGSPGTPGIQVVPKGLAAAQGPTSFAPVLQVVVSTQTAATFGLHPGSKIRITGPTVQATGGGSTITLDVTGVVGPRDPSSPFWTADATMLAPDLQCSSGCQPYWVGGVFAGDGEIGAMEADFGIDGLNVQWELPMDVSSLDGQQAGPLSSALNGISTQPPPLHGDVAALSSALAVSSDLLRPLNAFLATAQAVDTLLWLVYVSIAVAGLAVLLLAARMVVMRRSAELTLRRARGESLWQIAAAAGGGGALACVPAAVAGVIIAVVLVPGPVPPDGWWPPLAVLAVAVGSPAVVAAWQRRLPRHRGRSRRPRQAQVRLVVEATAVAAAVAGVIVFRQQGSQAGAGVNLYTSATPVLVAVPAVILVLRVYPLALRWLLRGYARGSGATTFVGLARASRAALTPAQPVFVLVLALTIAAFAGMVQDAVTRAEVAASWQTTGADVMIMTSSQQDVNAPFPSGAPRALAAVPGVTHAAAVWQTDWYTRDAQHVTGLAVDPASYAALVAATQTFPAVPARLLAAAAAGAPQPVLASPQAAADLGTGVATLSPQGPVNPVRVRVAGLLSGTPALPGGAAFVIMPLSVLHSDATPPQPPAALVDQMLLTGAGINPARLATVLHDVAPGAVATFRSGVLESMTTAPLQHGTFVLFALALAVAAGLGLAVMLFELALGAAEREATLARLATMGLGEGQRARVVMLEVLPAVVAAAVAAWACAVVLPRLVAPAIDLSVFTGSPTAVPLAPDVASVALPLAGLAVVAAAALAVEIRSGRRRVAASLRVNG